MKNLNIRKKYFLVVFIFSFGGLLIKITDNMRKDDIIINMSDSIIIGALVFGLVGYIITYRIEKKND
ncbi:hypothetical protein [Sediminibacillus sp. JSM 1682029]|uniref:hypothetical protein n=1 Tax=Sediminibacillus sp. JSM 1682029 TaxID=3229857 RepID=UPI0035265FB7